MASLEIEPLYREVLRIPRRGKPADRQDEQDRERPRARRWSFRAAPANGTGPNRRCPGLRFTTERCVFLLRSTEHFSHAIILARLSPLQPAARKPSLIPPFWADGAPQLPPSATALSRSPEPHRPFLQRLRWAVDHLVQGGRARSIASTLSPKIAARAETDFEDHPCCPPAEKPRPCARRGPTGCKRRRWHTRTMFGSPGSWKMHQAIGARKEVAPRHCRPGVGPACCACSSPSNSISRPRSRPICRPGYWGISKVAFTPRMEIGPKKRLWGPGHRCGPCADQKTSNSSCPALPAAIRAADIGLAAR